MQDNDSVSAAEEWDLAVRRLVDQLPPLTPAAAREAVSLFRRLDAEAAAAGRRIEPLAS